MLTSTLIGDITTAPKYRLSPWRWFILFFFSVSNMNQCLAWFSFSSVDEASMQQYFGERMTKKVLDLLLNWGPIIGVVCFPAQSWLMQQPGGLRKGLWCGILLCFCGNVVRCIPLLCVLCGGKQALVQYTAAFFCYHAGQIFIAAAGPFQMAATSRLALVWFGEHERTSATGIAATSNALGTTIGFLNPLWLSRSPSEIPNIFWLSLCVQIVPVACAALYLPVAPPQAPSAAAYASSEAHGQRLAAPTAEGDGMAAAAPDGEAVDGEGGRRKAMGWLSSIGRGCSSRSFVVLIVMASVLSGVGAAWQALFQSMLAPIGISDAAVGWVGFANGGAGNAGAILSGMVIDRLLRRRLKLGILAGVLGACLSAAWFTLMLPCLGSSAPVIPHSNGTLLPMLASAATLEGFFQGLTIPLFYELAAELLYPLREGLSAGLLVLLWNVSSAILIFLNGYIPSSSINLIMTATLVLVLVVIGLFVREEYRRPLDAGPS